MDFRFPDPTQRTLILGSTGSGKSQMGAHVLSRQPLKRMPWIVIDFKREELFNSIDRVRYLGPRDNAPKQPGLYIMPLSPSQDEDALEKFLWKVHAKEKIGIFLDEGYMIDKNSAAMQALYTQGRSKKIPVITLSQRPVWLSRFAFSEANHYVYLRLNDRRDQDTIKAFVPHRDPIWNLDTVYPKYAARWYDNSRHASFSISPAPSADVILQRFDDALRTERKVYT